MLKTYFASAAVLWCVVVCGQEQQNSRLWLDHLGAERHQFISPHLFSVSKASLRLRNWYGIKGLNGLDFCTTLPAGRFQLLAHTLFHPLSARNFRISGTCAVHWKLQRQSVAGVGFTLRYYGRKMESNPRRSGEGEDSFFLHTNLSSRVTLKVRVQGLVMQMVRGDGNGSVMSFLEHALLDQVWCGVGLEKQPHQEWGFIGYLGMKLTSKSFMLLGVDWPSFQSEFKYCFEFNKLNVRIGGHWHPILGPSEELTTSITW